MYNYNKLSLLLIFFATLFLILLPSLLRGMGSHTNRVNYNLILISIDTLRADHLGCYGYKDIKTPVIDRLASEGILFMSAFTPVPITLPSHVSIMTGLYPIQHGIRNNGNFILRPDVVTLAELMKKKGYKTGACIGAFVLDSLFGLDQGFDFYDDSLPKDKSVPSVLENERRAEAVTESGLSWLKENKDNPFFLWLHYFDPHAIYLPPSPFDKEYKGHPYDGEIAYTDKCIGDFLQGLEKMGLMENTILILTSDHGEGLGDHGEPSHAIFIYDSTLHVPLILWGPGKLFPKGKKIDTMVSVLDIFPTVLEVFSIPFKGAIPGKSLIPLIEGEKDIHYQAIFCESLYPELNFGWSRLEGIRTQEWKYISAPKPELYYLIEDQKEKKNIYSEKINIWQERLEKLKADLGPENGAPVPLERNVKERLESLGYIWSPDSKASTMQKADPKDMITIMEIIDKGVTYIYLGLYKKAEKEFKKVLEVNPDNASALFYLASVEEKLENLEEAEHIYKRLLAISPNYLDVHNRLGVIYHKKGKLEMALMEFELAAEQAKYPEIYYNLSVIYRLKGDYDKALKAAHTAIELDPLYANVLNQLGQLAMDKGNTQKAKEYFDKALDIEPNHLEAHNNLGVVYHQDGKHAEALVEIEKALSIDPNNAEAYNNLGSIYLTQGQYGKAEEALKKAIKLKAAYVEGFINLGLVYIYTKDYATAKDIYEEAIKLKPDYQNSWTHMGLLYLSQMDYERAYNTLKKALKIGPESADIYYYLGKACFGLKQFSQALEFWEKAISLNPAHKQAHLNMGEAFYDLGMLQEATRQWERAYELDPKDPLPLNNIATLKFQKGEYLDAIHFWEKGLELDPNLNEPYLHIGTSYLKQNEFEKAIEVWNKLLERKPNNVEAIINIGTALYQMGDLDEAIMFWQKAKTLNPENSKIYFNLGLAFFSKGNYRQSLQELREVLRTEPDNKEAMILFQQAKELI